MSHLLRHFRVYSTCAFQASPSPSFDLLARSCSIRTSIITGVGSRPSSRALSVAFSTSVRVSPEQPTTATAKRNTSARFMVWAPMIGFTIVGTVLDFVLGSFVSPPAIDEETGTQYQGRARQSKR